MQYQTIVSGIFRSRPNRFIAHVDIGGTVQVCHVKNTGRCRELLVPGAVVYLEYKPSANRKTQYDLIAVEKGERLINMDAAAPNAVFREWAAAGKFLPDVTEIRPEAAFGASRLDFRITAGGKTCWVEVKGVTLERDGAVFFPDAPTQRGVRHLQELQRAVEQGDRACAVFVIQMADVTHFAPNDETHPAFGAALRQAAAAGVQVLALCCSVTPDSLQIDKAVPAVL